MWVRRSLVKKKNSPMYAFSYLSFAIFRNREKVRGTRAVRKKSIDIYCASVSFARARVPSAPSEKFSLIVPCRATLTVVSSRHLFPTLQRDGTENGSAFLSRS